MREILTLIEPIQKGERRVESLSFGPILVKHLRACDGIEGEVEATLALASAICGEPVALLEEMGAADYGAMVALLEGLYEKK